MPSVIAEPVDAAYDTFYSYIIAPYAEPSREKLLPDIPSQIKGREKPTLVISLDGTLIESQWTRSHGWRYIKRPGVDEFIAHLAPLYELVLWTDSLSTADTVIDRLDPRKCFRHRLYRDATTYSGGLHRKDLTALNRDLSQTLIIDCDPQAYSFQPSELSPATSSTYTHTRACRSDLFSLSSRHITDHGISVSKYSSEADPEKKDEQLKQITRFLYYLAIAKRLGTVTDFSAELQQLEVSTNLENNNGKDFEAAVDKRFAELRAEGKMPQMQRGGRVTLAGGQGSTIWSRMGIGGR